MLRSPINEVSYPPYIIFAFPPRVRMAFAKKLAGALPPKTEIESQWLSIKLAQHLMFFSGIIFGQTFVIEVQAFSQFTKLL